MQKDRCYMTALKTPLNDRPSIIPEIKVISFTVEVSSILRYRTHIYLTHELPR